MIDARRDKFGRRKFIGKAAAAGLMLLKPGLVRGTEANSAIRLGLLGCGARGTAVATSFTTNTSARVVALADLFSDQLEKAKRSFDDLAARMGHAAIDRKLMFKGPHAYRQLAESQEIDMVQISTPNFFHPDHLEAAVEAGKHVYCEKPVAVDVRGAMRVWRTGEKAQGRLSLDVGFQIRSAPPYVEMVRRIHGGALGKIACGSAYYHATAINYPPRPNASPLELRIRNFLWDRVLSGDIIVDQNIHVIDICNWVLREHPLKAVGTGGRRLRNDSGDCWDHFDVILTYPEEIHISFNSFQYGNGLWDVAERFVGSKGVSESHYSGVVGIYGDEPWEWEGSAVTASHRPGRVNPYALGTEQGSGRQAGVFRDALEFADAEKDKAFVQSILDGKYHNQAAEGAEATLSAILARTAAYARREVTWDELLASDQVYDPVLEGIELSEFE
jgi:predicted dehydrogenase